MLEPGFQGSDGSQGRSAGREETACLIRSRRTIHVFEPDPVSPDLIHEAIALACRAPNHRLTEPWRFHLLGPETADAVARLNADLVAAKRGVAAGRAKLARWRKMPGWLVVTVQVAEDALRAREDYAACCCAVQNLMLYLWSAGVGTKWTTGDVTRDARFYELIHVEPAAEAVVGLIWYGYPAEVPETPRKPLEAVLVALP